MGCTCAQVDKASGEHRLMTPNLVTAQLAEYPVLLYSSTQSVDSQTAKDLLKRYWIPFEYFEVDRMSTK